MSSLPNSSKDTELTMCDVLQEEQELEDDANAVLGGSDDTNCSYDKGSVPRQALYACMTCKVSGEAGVCLACCYACHDGHEVVELYTKRNFRCDCGNSKFTDKTCTLRPEKEPLNLKNKYNHNFKGVYCSCRRPYPDLEDNVSDEMIQCVMCEDWYHGRHLGSEVPDDYFEMICQACMESHKFLYSYLSHLTHIKVDDDENSKKPTSERMAGSGTHQPEVGKDSIKLQPTDVSNGSVSQGAFAGMGNNVMDTVEENIKNGSSGPGTVMKSSEIKKEHRNGSIDVKSEMKEPRDGERVESSANGDVEMNATDRANCNSLSSAASTSIKVEAINMTSDVKKDLISGCLLKHYQGEDIATTGSAFWPENWRNELCHCSSCMNMYFETQCDFLLNPDDTIKAYEERGAVCSSESQYDKGLSALGKLDRVKQMEAVRAYTNMKGELLEYLKEFADNKRTVCESDIKEFFERMGKKQKLNNGVPHYCR